MNNGIINGADSQEPTVSNENQENKRNPNYFLIASIFIVLIIIVSFFVLLSKNNNSPLTSSVINCKNLKCLALSSQNCGLANLTDTETIDLFGINSSSTYYYEIRGLKQNKCIFYFQLKKITSVFPSGISQEIINQQQTLLKDMEGKEATCQFNTPDLTNLLNRWIGGNFSSEDFNVANCSGSYFPPTTTSTYSNSLPSGGNVTVTVTQ